MGTREPAKRIGARLRSYRQRSGYSVVRAARALGFYPGAVRTHEAGREPRAAAVVAYARLYGVRPSDIYAALDDAAEAAE